jgi:hypothetical protein
MSVRTLVSRGLPVLVTSLALAACSGGGATTGAGQPAGGAGSSQPPGATAATVPAGSAAGPVTGHVGDKLAFANFANDPVDATLVKIYDPATPNDATQKPLSPATHWVGAEITVNDQVDYQSDAGGFDAVTSGGTTVTTQDTYQNTYVIVGGGFKGCTQTDGIGQDVNPYTYCVAFPVPDGQTLVKVGVNVTGAPLVKTDQATWTVP